MANNLDYKTICEMMENMLTGVAFLGLQEDKLEFLYMNSGGFRMLGYTPTVGYKYLNNLVSLILDEDKPKFWQAIEDVLKDDGAVDLEMRTVTASGSLRWLQIRGNLYERTAERAVILCVFLDATDRKFVENEIQTQSEWYQMLLETEGEMLADYNAKTDVLSIKTASEYGLESTRIIDKFMMKLRRDMSGTVEERKLVETIEEALKSPRTDIVELKTKIMNGGEKRWYRIHTSRIAGVDGYVTHIVGKITDIHENKLLQEELRGKEKLDTVTGWYNRQATKEQVNQILASSDDHNVHGFILIDISDFRILSESLGEDMGNRILKDITKKMSRGFKRSDILGRISEDELVIFAQNIGSVHNLDALASMVCHSTEMTLGSGADGFTLAGRVGISLYPYQGDNWQELNTKAERAVNSLKGSGKVGYHVYDLSGILKIEGAENERQQRLLEETDSDENLESLLEKIINEEKQNENLTRAMLKMVIRHFGFQKACLSMEGTNGKAGLELRYFNPGYEQKEEQNFTDETQQWVSFLKRIKLLGGFQIIHNYDDVPEELASYMLRNKIYTLLIQPMMAKGEIKGVFLMGECTGKEWHLNTEEEKELKRILQLIQIYVLKIERKQNGCTSLNDARLLDDFDSYVMAVDYDTYELCFANRKMLSALPDLRIGDYCYRTYAGQDRPCESCIMKKLDRNNPHSKWSEEWFSSSLRSWLKVHGSWMQNDANGATCVLNSMDISEYFMGNIHM